MARFWIAGIVKHNAVAMLTTAPGPDMEPYHGRQICLLSPAAGMDWLTLDKPEAALLKQPPKGRLQVRMLRRDGVEVSSP